MARRTIAEPTVVITETEVSAVGDPRVVPVSALVMPTPKGAAQLPRTRVRQMGLGVG